MDIQGRKDKIQRNAQTFKNLTGREASALHRDSPQEYAALKSAAQEAGVIHGSGYRQPGLHAQHYVDVTPPRSTQEIKARIQWPKEEVLRYYNNPGNANPSYDLAKLAASAPLAYASLREAAMSYSIIERSETKPARRPVDAQPEGSESPVTLGDRLGKLANLPPTTPVTPEQLFDLIDVANAIDAAKAA